MSAEPPPILAIVGPTATGKTHLAIELALRTGAEIVGVDASQIYRGLDIGTGKARTEDLRGVRHHLIDVVPPDADFDAAAYVGHADAALSDLAARGRPAILCGGTGLYLRALVDGLCDAPPASAEVRAGLRARIEAGELEALHAELAVGDPEAAARIAPRDRQRIERALGVLLSTHKPLTAWQREAAARPARHNVRVVGLFLERPALATRIEARVRAMFGGGLLDEVETLLAAGHSPELRSLQALGYPQAVAVLRGHLTVPQAIEDTVRVTRQYAKRQETWFRAHPDLSPLRADTPGSALLAEAGRIWGLPEAP